MLDIKEEQKYNMKEPRLTITKSEELKTQINYYLKNSMKICEKVIEKRKNLSMNVLVDTEKELYREFDKTNSSELKGIILEILAEAYHYTIPPKVFWKFLGNIFKINNIHTKENILMIVYPVFMNLRREKDFNDTKLCVFKGVVRKFWLENDFFSNILFEILKASKHPYTALLFLWTLTFSQEATSLRKNEIINTLIVLIEKEIELKEFRLIIKILENFYKWDFLKELSLSQLSNLIDYATNKNIKIDMSKDEEMFDFYNLLLNKLKILLESKMNFTNYLEQLKFPLQPSEINKNIRFWNTNIQKFVVFKKEIIAKYLNILYYKDTISSKIVLKDLNRLLTFEKYTDEIVYTCISMGFKDLLMSSYKLNDIELKAEVIKALNMFLTVEWNLN